ncbi:hypothetical protein BXZ70DRAFT_896654 [Cristinia sonorae]|uniref:UBC core domain-containing protein n=1 Tax=Cristinia sonorae TaxID=1940300 RepID=A0A8K0XMY6_9AGAR|nr:hypothetical protein BXZ70DRAFT_896654 [Cristinia sonorae]
MPAQKRRATAKSSLERPSTKRTRNDDSTAHEVIELLDDDESMESIMARIQEQERNEVLMRQLDKELNGSAGPSGSTSQSTVDQAVIAFDGEDDEALARRLAAEWEQEDSIPMDVDPDSNEPLPSNSDGATRDKSLASTSQSSRHETGPRPSAEDDLLSHRNLFVHTRRCTNCGADIDSPRGYVTYTPQVPPPSLIRLLHTSCSSCKTNHCRGCFSPVECSLTCNGNKSNSPSTCAVINCCAEVRAIAVFEALGGFDRVYIAEQATADTRAKEATANRRSTSGTIGSVGPGGTGYGTGSSSGYSSWGAASWGHISDDLSDPYGYSGGAHGRGRGRGRGSVAASPHRRNVAANGQSSSFATKTLAAHWDEILVRALSTITTFLPAPYSDDAQTYDILPHNTIPPLILMSKLPELLGVLLRNDSITDWTARSEVYSAMLGLLRRFADSEVTMQVLTGQRWETKKSCGLEEWMWQNGEITWEISANNTPAIATPLYSHFKKVTKQCETFMAGASQMLENDDAGEETEKIVQATSLCGDMLAAKEDIERAMIIMGKDPEAVANGTPQLADDSSSSSKGKGKESIGETTGKGRNPDVDMDRTYRLRCEQLAFKSVEIPNIHLPGYYHYAQMVTQSTNATRIPKNRIHFIKEMAVMATSLPPGIWVRNDETRNDIIKVMIAGPEGTPYSDGLFEFDCFIPLEYPHKPPLMNLRTTGRGQVRFNPNLYSNGKVCLSLLGTWPGSPEEMWNPKSSTLLQVLVSIQSMILIDLPYFNEPGFGKATENYAPSREYNKNISLQTTRWAIVEWLKDEHKDGIWRDVIASHFTIRESRIRKRYVFFPSRLPVHQRKPFFLPPSILAWSRSNPQFFNYVFTPHNGIVGLGMNIGPNNSNLSMDMVMAMDGGFGGAQSWGRARWSNPPPVAKGLDLCVVFEGGMKVVKGWAAEEAVEAEQEDEE